MKRYRCLSWVLPLDPDLVALEFGALDEVVERLGGLLAGEDEVVAGVAEPLRHALAGEEIVGQIRRAQRL